MNVSIVAAPPSPATNTKRMSRFPRSPSDFIDEEEVSDFSDEDFQMSNDCHAYSISKPEYLDPTEADITETEVSSYEEEYVEYIVEGDEVSYEEVIEEDYVEEEVVVIDDDDHHLDQYAAVIQAAFRGMLQRQTFRQSRIDKLEAEIYFLNCFAATCIQTNVRGMLGRKLANQHRAAATVQAAARGYLARLGYRVMQLEEKLKQIQASRQSDLLRIQQNKKHEMRAFKKETEKEYARIESKAVKASAKIDKMREENKKLRDQNRTLQKAAYIMTAKNERTEQSTEKLGKNEASLSVALEKLKNDAVQIKQVHEDHVVRLEQYEGAIGRCEDNLELEKRIAAFALLTIESMMDKIQSECNDEKLVNSLDEAVNKALLR